MRVPDGNGAGIRLERSDLDVVNAMFRGSERGILEGWVDFAMEISVIVAHGLDGDTAAYVPVENRHVNHILDTTIAPAAIAPGLAARARTLASRAAEELDVIGLLAVEMFVTWKGDLLVNEIAPRPHHS